MQSLKVRGFFTVAKCCLMNSRPVALFLASQVRRSPGFLKFPFNDDQGSLVLHRPSIYITSLLPSGSLTMYTGVLVGHR